MDEDELWTRWFDTRLPETRNQLVETYYHWVRTHSFMWSKRTGFPHDEYMAWSVIGLMSAIETWDRESTSFRTWAFKKMKWAVMDGLRETTVHSRSQYEHIGQYLSLLDKWRMENGGGYPSDEEATKELGWTPKRTKDIRRIVYQFSKMLHYMAFSPAGEDATEYSSWQESVLPTSPGADVDAVRAVINDGLSEKLMIYLASLPEQAKIVIHFLYYEEWTLKRIGDEILGLTESRVSQIHSSAIKMLRTRMSQAGDIDPSLLPDW